MDKIRRVQELRRSNAAVPIPGKRLVDLHWEDEEWDWSEDSSYGESPRRPVQKQVGGQVSLVSLPTYLLITTGQKHIEHHFR